ncbi:Tat (twin-arginine translocation) pathway signal sequence [Pseudomonas flavescens]|uniref:Tat (Twin-arginine translocation) pathway signal sequence n=1 Tax=Phytopseudomonas flavescens TaxID=29435 RepID=A0A1G8H7J8_9GAMM|nr:aldo/keto reductase [Pseudomonas flavescens]SDI02585.1 Tat (twin-arginine translocation) pathway signal sequence [Pseudomonas flavescens]
MPSRRHFLQGSAALMTLAAGSQMLPGLALAANPAPLLQRKIASSGEALPVIGLGTSQTFNVSLDNASLKPLDEVVRAFINGGATLIDTAPSYGAAETVTGELLKRTRTQGKAFLASKLSSTGRERGLAQFEASLKALQTDKMDLLQVHNLQDTTTQLALARELREQGKVRYIGITHYIESAHDDLLGVLAKEKVDFVQLNYSVGERNAEKRLLPYCAEHGIATLINRPFQRAQLLGRVKGKPLPEWAHEIDATSWAQLLLKFILANPAVTAVIPATSNPRYVVDNLKAGQGRLPDAQLRERIVQAFS